MKNFIYIFSIAAFIAAPMHAMEKRAADTELSPVNSKKICRKITLMQPVVGQSHLEQLPLEITEIILGYLSHADGNNEDIQLRNAAKNIHHFMSLSKTMRALESNLEIHKQIIPALAKGNQEKLFNAAIALHTNGAAQWIQQVFTTENLPISYNRALHNAIQAGDAGSAAFILQHAPQSVHQKITLEGSTPLIFASAFGNKKIITLLLAAGADSASYNLNNETALWHAATGGNVEIAQMLLDKAPATSEHGNSTRATLLNFADRAQWRKPLAQAVIHGHAPMVQLLLQHGANPNNTFIGIGTPAFDKVTVLHHAAQMGNLAIVDLLLKAKANANAQSNGHKASCQGVNTRRADMSALMLAAQNGHALVVQRLLEEPNIDVDARTIEGKTALDLAKESTSENKNEIITALKQHSKEKNKKKKS